MRRRREGGIWKGSEREGLGEEGRGGRKNRMDGGKEEESAVEEERKRGRSVCRKDIFVQSVKEGRCRRRRVWEKEEESGAQQRLLGLCTREM